MNRRLSSFVRHVALVLLLASPSPMLGQGGDIPSKEPSDGLGDPLPRGVLARLGTTRLRHQAYVVSLAYSPNGKLLASGSYDSTIAIWDALSGKLLHRLNAGTYVYALDFSPDSKFLAATGEKNVVQFWDAATGAKLGQIAASELGPAQREVHSVSGLRFSSDGKVLAAAGFDHVIRLWRLNYSARTGDTIVAKKLHHLPGAAMDFSPDGRKLVSAGAKKVSLWDIETGANVKDFQHDDDGIDSVSFAANGRLVATASRNAVWVLDPTTGKNVRLAKGEAAGSPVAFAPDGKTLASGDGHKDVVKLWDAANGTLLHELHGHGSYIKAVAFAPDGKTLATGSWDGAVRLWQTDRGQEIALPGHRYEVNAVTVSPHGRLIATLGGDGNLRFWGGVTGQPLRTIKLKDVPNFGHNYWGGLGTRHLAFSPDGLQLAGAGYLWEVKSGAETLSLEGASGPIAFSPDGTLLAIVPDWRRHRGPMVEIWDVNLGRKIREINPHEKGAHSYDAQVSAVAFSPDGKLLATGSSNARYSRDGEKATETVHLWEAASGKMLRKFAPTHEAPASLVFSPDGQKLFSSGNRVQCWQVGTGKPTAHFAAERHMGTRVQSAPLALSLDGRLLAHSGPGNTIVLRETLTGKEVHKLQGHTSGVNSLAFFPDGRRLVSGSADHTALIWDLAPDRADLEQRGGKLIAKELHDLLQDLGSADAHLAYRAVWLLVLAPDKTVPFLKEHLTPLPLPDPKAIPRWLADLDSNNYPVRNQAAMALRKLGPAAEEPLLQALGSNVSLEMRRRLENILGEIQRQEFAPEIMRHRRALQVLELIGSPEVDTIAEAQAVGGPARREVADILGRLHTRRQGEPVAPPLPKKMVVPPARQPHVLTGHAGEITALTFSSDSANLISSGLDGTIRFWSAATGAAGRVIKAGPKGIYALAIAPDGKRVAAGGEHVELWDTATGQSLQKLAGHRDKVVSLTFHADGNTLISGSYDQTIRVWDSAKAQTRHVLDARQFRILSLAISPDGKTLASGGLEVNKNFLAGVAVPILFPAGIQLWSLETGKRLENFKDQGPFVAFAPDGRAMAWITLSTATLVAGPSGIYLGGRNSSVGSVDWKEVTIKAEDVLTVWDHAGKRSVFQMTGLGDMLAFSADGRFLAVARGSELHREPFEKVPTTWVGDGRPRLIEMATGREVLQFPAQRVTALAISPNGQKLAAAGPDGTVLLWDLSPLPPGAKPGRDLAKYWSALAGADAGAANEAWWSLRAVPENAVALLQERMSPPSAQDPHIVKLIAGLDADSIAEQERAFKELERLGAATEPALLKALPRLSSVSHRQLVVQLLGAAGIGEYPEALGRIRGTALLEAIASPSAVQLLQMLSEGSPLSSQTVAAKAALQRLRKKDK